MVFVQGLMSLLQRYLERVPRSVRHWIIALCGFIALATPLALWISMTVWGMKMILIVFSIAICVICLLVWSSPDEHI
ncbi:MAG: hypothetical protein ACR2PA_08180 [Hyphomicrobiaceae bacterium]